MVVVVGRAVVVVVVVVVGHPYTGRPLKEPGRSRALRTPLSALPDAALEVDEAGVVLDANDLALELFGCDHEDLAGRVL